VHPQPFPDVRVGDAVRVEPQRGDRGAQPVRQVRDGVPLGGEELQRIVARVVSPAPEVIAKVKEAIRPRNTEQETGR